MDQRLTRSARSALLACSLAAGLAACGGGGSSSSTPPAPAPAPAPVPTPAPPAVPPTADEAARFLMQASFGP
ncbi:MAG TPA: hypothetical protein PLW72_17000, partial [Burkholderiaceae bacterium]|nr:hypothetical protein [Burkholderiaceae bacterium]